MLLSWRETTARFTSEWNGGQRLTHGVLKYGVCDNDNDPLKDVGQNEDMELLQALVDHRAILTEKQEISLLINAVKVVKCHSL